MLFALILTSMQLTLAQERTLADGIKDIAAIDSELQQITEHQDELRKSRAARVDEISSLRSRYPEIQVDDESAIETTYKALYRVRMDRAAKLKPLAVEKKRAADVEVCTSSQRVQELRAKIEAADGYKNMTLEERLEWRKAMDTLKPPATCG